MLLLKIKPHKAKQTQTLASLTAGMASAQVFNHLGEHLGDIVEILFNEETGRVEYAVLAYCGADGLDGRYYAVPWRALKACHLKKHFILYHKKEQIENAPLCLHHPLPRIADNDLWAIDIKTCHHAFLAHTIIKN